MLLLRTKDNGEFVVNTEIIDWQIKRIESIGRNYIYRTTISKLLIDEIIVSKKRALSHISDSLYLTFVVEWCSVFGKDKNTIHWKNAIVLDADSLAQNKLKNDYINYVRKSTLEGSRISLKEFRSCWESMTDARNKYFAHIDIGMIPTTPYTKTPLKIACAYSDIIASLIDENGELYHPFPLAERLKTFKDEALSVLIPAGKILR